MAVFIQRVVVLEKAGGVQAEEIGADGVEAAVHVVAAVRGGVHRVVGHGGQDLGHGGVLLVGEGLVLLLLVQHRRVFQGVVDAVQQHVGDVDGGHRDGVDEEDDQQTAEEAGHDLAHRLPHGPRHVRRLAGHLEDAEAEGQDDGDEGHGPEGVGHRVVAEEDVDEKVGVPLVKNLGGAGKDIEEGLDKVHQVEKALKQAIEQDEYPVKEQS